MIELFVGLNLLWYVGFFGFFIVMSVLSEREKIELETALIAIFILAGSYFGPFDILSWIEANTADFILSIVVWLAIGSLWALTKWIHFVYKRKRLYISLKKKWTNANNHKIKIDDPIPDEFKSRFKNYLSCNDFLTYRNKTIAPLVKQNADKFYNWIVFWPFSICSTIFTSILADVLVYIKSFAQKASDKIFGNYKNDLDNNDENI